jgi:hypothetical protein
MSIAPLQLPRPLSEVNEEGGRNIEHRSEEVSGPNLLPEIASGIGGNEDGRWQ